MMMCKMFILMQNKIMKIENFKKNNFGFQNKSLKTNEVITKEQKIQPISVGEIFDPEEELKKIRLLPKEEKPEALKLFKEKLNYQRKGLSSVQINIAEKIRENPDISRDELSKIVNSEAIKYGINKKQIKTTENILDEYFKRHQNIKELREEFSDDKDLFKELFGKEPEGEIQITNDPVNFYIRCASLNDYAFIYSKGFLNQNEKISLKQKRWANKSGGASIYESLTDKSGPFAIENSKIPKIFLWLSSPEFIKEAYKKVHDHEEQHIITELIREQNQKSKDEDIIGNAKKRLDKALYAKNLFGDGVKNISLDLELKRFLRIIRSEIIEPCASNEIFSLLKSHTLYEAKRILKKNKLYDFFHTGMIAYYINGLKEKLLENSNSIEKIKTTNYLEKTINNVFIVEYYENIRKGINAIANLRDHGYSDDKIIALLIHEPLNKWEKIVNRLIIIKK